MLFIFHNSFWIPVYSPCQSLETICAFRNLCPDYAGRCRIEREQYNIYVCGRQTQISIFTDIYDHFINTYPHFFMYQFQKMFRKWTRHFLSQVGYKLSSKLKGLQVGIRSLSSGYVLGQVGLVYIRLRSLVFTANLG